MFNIFYYIYKYKLNKYIILFENIIIINNLNLY